MQSILQHRVSSHGSGGSAGQRAAMSIHRGIRLCSAGSQMQERQG